MKRQYKDDNDDIIDVVTCDNEDGCMKVIAERHRANRFNTAWRQLETHIQAAGNNRKLKDFCSDRCRKLIVG